MFLILTPTCVLITDTKRGKTGCYRPVLGSPILTLSTPPHCGRKWVGKTVLLTRFFEAAQDRNWIVTQVEAGAGKSLREALGEALHAPLADLARPSAGKRLQKGLKTALRFKASYDAAGT